MVLQSAYSEESLAFVHGNILVWCSLHWLSLCNWFTTSIWFRLWHTQYSHHNNHDQTCSHPRSTQYAHCHERTHLLLLDQPFIQTYHCRSSSHQQWSSLSHGAKWSKQKGNWFCTFIILQCKFDDILLTSTPLVFSDCPPVNEEEAWKSLDTKSRGQCSFCGSVYFSYIHLSFVGFGSLLSRMEFMGYLFVRWSKANAVTAPWSIELHQPNLPVSQIRIKIQSVQNNHPRIWGCFLWAAATRLSRRYEW